MSMFQILREDETTCYHTTGVYHSLCRDPEHDVTCRLAEVIIDEMKRRDKEEGFFEMEGGQFPFMMGFVGYDCMHDVDYDVSEIDA